MIKTSAKKKKSALKASQSRSDGVKEKIIASINSMRTFNEKITVWNVHKDSKVSYETCKKYKVFIEAQSKPLPNETNRQ